MPAADADDTLAGRMLALNQKLLGQYLKGLENDSPQVRRKSIRGLESLRSLAVVAIPALEKALEDQNLQVRKAAAAALQSIRSHGVQRN
jgi:HEAT repeat protein